MSAQPHTSPPSRALETGPYILRSLISDVNLSDSGGDDEGTHITCVEVWKENLYIGTSAGSIIHYVQLPPDPSDPANSAATYIFASRLTPPVNANAGSHAGIQQMLLLPSVSKACILSSNTLNFYTLPELSPAFPQLKPLACGWVGGVDLNDEENAEDDDGARGRGGGGGGGVSIMMCLRNKIRLVNISDTAVKERDIEFGGCLATVRRGNIACVADARSYALVDVVAQQKIPLLPISSMDEQSASQAGTGSLQEDAWPSSSTAGGGGGGGGRASRSSSVAGQRERLAVQEKGGHSRSTSLGIFRPESPFGDSPRNSMSSRHGFDVPSIFNRQTSPRPQEANERRSSLGPDIAKPLPAPPEEGARHETATPPPSSSLAKSFVPLRPIIASPSESEFLLVTGTAPSEAGLGMFVNLDGEIVRGTMEFSSFPESMVTDGKGMDLAMSVSGAEIESTEEGYVLSVVQRHVDGVLKRDVEIQRWDVDPTQAGSHKQWLGIATAESSGLGLRRIVDSVDFELSEIVDLLAQKAIRISDTPSSASPGNEKVAKREREERAYYHRMSTTTTRLLTWTSSQVFWTLRNPLVLRLNARLALAERASPASNTLAPQRSAIEHLLNDLRGQRSQTELEFYTLSYIRQKAALLLFIDLLLQTQAGTLAFERDKSATEDALLESEIDPRFVLLFLPGIQDEILAAQEGIWVQGGTAILVRAMRDQWDPTRLNIDISGPYGENMLKVVKRYLTLWRRKRGNPSVVDGEHVFPTVDAALLRILLMLDKEAAPGPATAGSVRAELNALVDSGVECFPRAVELLEQHERLYILSRLYQSRKNAAKVLQTWQRIISGSSPDAGGEFPPHVGESELKMYLTKLRNRALVEEFGAWLASRNPSLGVQVFADESSRTTFAMGDALKLLREKAPNAVKVYLEYLVFSRKQSQHINELLAYYLDIVVSALSSQTSNAKQTLQETYETYRALQAPKPTYRQFIAENAPPDTEWWDARLRLLQLLGSEAAEGVEAYDVEFVVDKLGGYAEWLVPEMIVLDGRRGRHEEAIRLLTHGLGDFDMAVSYCLRGGYGGAHPASPPSSSGEKTAAATPSTQQDETHRTRKELFHTLLLSLLSLPDLTDRIERTSELLERFASFFDIRTVVELVPESWAVEVVGGFLVRALGAMVRERNQGRVVRALWGSESLRVSVARIGVVEEKGAIFQGNGEGRGDGIEGS